MHTFPSHPPHHLPSLHPNRLANLQEFHHIQPSLRILHLGDIRLRPAHSPRQLGLAKALLFSARDECPDERGIAFCVDGFHKGCRMTIRLLK